MMERQPARVVGEFTSIRAAHDACKAHPAGEVPVALVVVGNEPGDGKEVYCGLMWPTGAEMIVFRCGCDSIDTWPLFGTAGPINSTDNGARWTLTSREPVHFEPSFVMQFTGGLGGTHILKRCHSFIHNGFFEPLSDSLPWNAER